MSQTAAPPPSWLHAHWRRAGGRCASVRVGGLVQAGRYFARHQRALQLATGRLPWLLPGEDHACPVPLASGRRAGHSRFPAAFSRLKSAMFWKTCGSTSTVFSYLIESLPTGRVGVEWRAGEGWPVWSGEGQAGVGGGMRNRVRASVCLLCALLAASAALLYSAVLRCAILLCYAMLRHAVLTQEVELDHVGRDALHVLHLKGNRAGGGRRVRGTAAAGWLRRVPLGRACTRWPLGRRRPAAGSRSRLPQQAAGYCSCGGGCGWQPQQAAR